MSILRKSFLQKLLITFCILFCFFLITQQSYALICKCVPGASSCSAPYPNDQGTCQVGTNPDGGERCCMPAAPSPTPVDYASHEICTQQYGSTPTCPNNYPYPDPHNYKNCTASSGYMVVQACSNVPLTSANITPPPDPDAPTAACGAGSSSNDPGNGWCGGHNKLYYCQNNAWHLKTDCAASGQTCVVNPGAADTCSGSGSGNNNGGGGSSGGNSGSGSTPTPPPSATCVQHAGGGGSDQFDNANGAKITCVKTWCNPSDNKIYSEFTFANGSATGSHSQWSLVYSRTDGQTPPPGYYQNVSNDNSSHTVTIGGFSPSLSLTAKVAGWSPFTGGYGIPYVIYTTASSASCTTSSDTPTPKPSLTPTPKACRVDTDCSTDGSTVCINHLCTPSLSASVSVLFEGIDTNNNTRPVSLSRKLLLYLYKDNNTAITDTIKNNVASHADFTSPVGVVTSPNVQSTTYGTFVNATFHLGNIPAGTYFVYVKSPEGSLRVPADNNPITLSAAGPNTISIANPLPLGDINGDNQIDLQDYNLWLQSYNCVNTSFSSLPSKCTTALTDASTGTQYFDTLVGLYTDLTSIGLVNGVPYNIILRNWGNGQ